MKLFGYNISKESSDQRPYKVGYALSGGGARGFAHAGAIKAMLEVGLKPDVIAGVSAGSVVAVMIGAGLKPQQIVEAFSSKSFTDLVTISMPRAGLFRLDKFQDFLRQTIPYSRLEELPIPTVVCATNFDTGQKVAFDKGEIAPIVAASCCIPIVFRPVKIGEYRYVDGGVLANLPAWAIRSKCRFLAGINCSPMVSDGSSDSMLSVAMRSYELMSKNNTTHDAELCDMLLRFDNIASHRTFSLDGIQAVFNEGYRTATEYFAARGIAVRAD